MTQKDHVNTSEHISDIAIEGLLEIKGQDVVRLNLSSTDTAVTDYFIIATGTSDRHVAALADSVITTLKQQADERPISKEGLAEARWVLIDYGSVVVHIFQEKWRQFYKLESLWGDCELETISEAA